MSENARKYLELKEQYCEFIKAFEALFIPVCQALINEVYPLGYSKWSPNKVCELPDTLLAQLNNETIDFVHTEHTVSFHNSEVRRAVEYEIRDRTNGHYKITTEGNVKKKEDPIKQLKDIKMTPELVAKLMKEFGYK